MAAIGIIDDRVDIRTTLQRKINLSIKKQKLDWITIGIEPFKEPRDYIGWIKENDIGILILDERLQEGNHDAINVDYNGSKLIEFIREALQDFPVFAITSYPTDGELQSKFPLFDEILSRDVFFSKSDEYTARFTRAGQRFLSVFNHQLLRISEISNKIALGEVSKTEIEELKTIQTYLNIPFTTEDYVSREVWLKDYKAKIDDLSTLSNKIKTFIDSHKK